MGLARFTALIASLGVLAACTASVSPSPSMQSPTPGCLGAWQAFSAIRTTSSQPDGPMGACASLDDFVAGYVAVYHPPEDAPYGFVPDPVAIARGLATGECHTGDYNDTPICQELGVTPTPELIPP